MSRTRGLTFINATGDTFTPTHSGAISTWIHELVLRAPADGVHPTVISRSSVHPSYDDVPRLHLLDYPRPARTRLGRAVHHRRRKLAGWVHDRQRQWVDLVAETVRREGLESDALVLNNDGALAVALSRLLPDAVIANLYQNQNDLPPRFRKHYAAAVALPMGVSAYTARWEEEHFGIAPGRVRVLYSGVDATRFVPRGSVSSSQRTCINFVGLTNANKGIDLLLEAVLRLARERDDVALQVCGSTNYGFDAPDELGRRLDALFDEITAAGVPVERPGFVPRPELPARLAAADITVVPSRWPEPFGLVALEGMASGLATVVARTGGLPEVVDDAALLFEPEDLDGLTECLRRFLDDPALRADYARRARARAEHMSWERTWHHLVTYLAEIGVELERSPAGS